MDYTSSFVLLSIVWTCIYLFSATVSRRRTTAKLPPGPYPYPIIGNIFQLGSKPHLTLATLSKAYGPLMSLKLGSKTTIVVSSPRIAKEVLQKHDLTCSSRSPLDGGNALHHHSNSMVWLPVGNQWRKYRKICKEQIFATPRLDASQGLRKKVVADLLEHARECCSTGEAMDVGGAAHTTTLNLLSNFFFSMDLAQHRSVSSQEFKHTVWALLEIGGSPNFVDYFPILKPIDPQRVRARTQFHYEKLFAIFDRIVDERMEERSKNSSSGNNACCNDALDSLLNLVEKSDSDLSLYELRHLFLDLFIAGTDTTSATVEWAMAELLRNPKKMAKAQSELKEVIGEDGIVKESDIARLPYLQALVKETFRLHPAAPFLIPHMAEGDIEVDGFLIPKNAQILVNLCAISQDPDVWLDPKTYMPERFIDSEIDFRGRDFEFIPFGAGRRICPGLPLAYKMVHLMLGSLLYSFHWKLEGDIKSEDMDMSEKFGITLQKTIPLKAIPIKL